MTGGSIPLTEGESSIPARFGWLIEVP